MITLLSLLCLLIAIGLLLLLTKIDLEYSLLPNPLVLAFCVTGFAFHTLQHFTILPPQDMAAGALLGAGLLWLIRQAANWYYKDDTLGLGDVKLMGAAGVWLGSDLILIALITGAMAGVLHGFALATLSRVKTGAWPDMTRFSLPAGPGFIVGIFIASAMLLKHFMIEIWPW